MESKTGLRLLMIMPVPPPAEGVGPHPYPMPVTLGCTDRVEVVYCEGAPAQVWDAAGARQVAPLVEEKARWAERQGYDALVVNCMLDPAVQSLYRALSVPVIGAGAAAFAAASLVGRRSALVYPEDLPVYELHADPADTLARLVVAAKHEIGQGADVLIPACTDLDGFAEALQAAVDVPVIPCARIALQAAETLAAHRLHGVARAGAYARWTWLGRILIRRARRAVAMLRG